MKKELSIYLDLVRFLAAVAVVIYHSNARNIVLDLLPLSTYGHSAVMVFFVLSGFVIAYISSQKENTPLAYWASRFGRIYSVALPALLLAPMLDVLGEFTNDAFYGEKTTHDYWYIRIISGLFFLNEIWFVSIMEFSNVPYWSLCYEVWYYVLYAIVAFTTGKKRIALFMGVCLLIGPKILLLAPIWWLGVFLYKNQWLKSLPESVGWVFFIASFVFFWLFDAYKVSDQLTDFLKSIIGEHWHKQLTFSKFFLGDYILGPIIAMNFAGFSLISHRFSKILSKCASSIRFFANYTFTLYLFHQPLIWFFAAVVDGSPENYNFYMQTMTCVVIAIYFLGKVTEDKKYVYKRFAQKHLEKVLKTM